MNGKRSDEDYKRTAFIGINNTGKTSRLVEVLENSYHFKLEYNVFPTTHRILILIRTTPTSLKNVQRFTSYEQLKGFQHGIALFWDFTTEPKKMVRNIINILGEGNASGKKYLQNGAMVFEDCASYIEQVPPDAVKQFLEDHRMYHLDLFFTVHSLRDLSAFIRRRVSYVRVFKTLDSFTEKTFDALNYPNGANVHHAWVNVMNSPDPYANMTIKTS